MGFMYLQYFPAGAGIVASGQKNACPADFVQPYAVLRKCFREKCIHSVNVGSFERNASMYQGDVQIFVG